MKGGGGGWGGRWSALACADHLDCDESFAAA